LQWSRGA